MITKTFLTTRNDLIAFYRASLNRNNGRQWILLSIALIVFGVLRLLSEDDLAGFYITAGVLKLCSYMIGPYNMSKKMLKQNALYRHDITLEISEERLRHETNQSNSFLMWEDAFDFYESKMIFLVYISQYQAYILPKRLFTADEAAIVSGMMRCNIVSKRKKGKTIFLNVLAAVLFAVIIIQIAALLMP